MESLQRVKGLKAAATVPHLEVVFNRRRLTRMHFGGAVKEEKRRTDVSACLQGGSGKRGLPGALAKAMRIQTLCQAGAGWLTSIGEGQV